MSIQFADISEHQANIDADAYLRETRVIVCRTHNGYRTDHQMPGRMAYLRGKPFTALGWYIYLAEDRDPAQQAREFVKTIGSLRENEFAVVDHEEGSGDQIARCEQALKVVDDWSSIKTTLYGGAAFVHAHLGGVDRWKRPLWLASYPNSYSPNTSLYPRGAEFWQYSDRARFGGLPSGVDGNYYARSADEFLAMVRGAVPTQPSRQPAIQQQTIVVDQQADGDQEVFTLDDQGVVWHRWIRDGQWQAWQSLGQPGSKG